MSMNKPELKKIIKECVIELLNEQSIEKSDLIAELDSIDASYKPYPDGNDSIQLFYKHSNLSPNAVLALANKFNYSTATASGPSFILTPKDGSTNEGLNHLGEREYNTYGGWIAAVKKIDPFAKFNGDRDINGAQSSDGKHLGEWDGEKGSVVVKKPTSIDETDKTDFSYNPYTDASKSNSSSTVPPVESEIKRTKNDFELGKKARKLETPIKVKTKALIQFKSKDTGDLVSIEPNTDLTVFCGPSGIYTFANNKSWSKIGYMNASKYLTKFKPAPSDKSMEKMMNDGIVTTPLGSRVEPDGTGPYNDPSWLIVMGLI